ncbi:hypothetical protein E3N88_29228 [Mikania micrantha]|uniref:Uncharacterized protein n=1 Tax=Mikania micrantha TaxID=192012 RepID=A0A5N6MI85_9ASTR|nr:hypothetical protein E3N88_29228 [Mikania micrantha]
MSPCIDRLRCKRNDCFSTAPQEVVAGESPCIDRLRRKRNDCFSTAPQEVVAGESPCIDRLRRKRNDCFSRAPQEVVAGEVIAKRLYGDGSRRGSPERDAREGSRT